MKVDVQIKKDMGEKFYDSYDIYSLFVEKEFYFFKYEVSVGNEFEDGFFDGLYFIQIIIIQYEEMIIIFFYCIINF